MKKELNLNEATTLVFDEIDDNVYRIYVDVDSNDFYKQQGVLILKKGEKVWTFWQTDGDGIDYYESLEKTIDQIAAEYQDQVYEDPDYFRDEFKDEG
jgi:hypothetical protein